jgi:hypothetical protein
LPPLTPDTQKTSLGFFGILDFLLQCCPPVPSEVDLRSRFAQIGVGTGQGFAVDGLSPEVKEAMTQGMADAWADFAALKQQVDAGQVTPGDLFGTRDYLQNNYLYRMAGAVLGIFGNSKQEAMYPFYTVDGEGKLLSGTHRYTLHFAADQLPPVNAFWSLTMYELPSSLLVANPLNRYLLNSPMLPQFQCDADGGLTFYIQPESPGADLEANWLPAPTGPFFCAMRLYWPQAEALDGTWQAPALQRV